MRARQRQLVVFVKAPRLGQAKSRLAAGIGGVAALGFYRRMMERLIRRLRRDARWRTVLATTPLRAGRPRTWPPGLQRRDQGWGDLGARMARVFRALPPGPVVIVGSDIPDLTATHVWTAFRALGRHEAVFGPASDGGYWLIGMRRRPAVPRALLAGVRWSSSDALADSRASLPARMSVKILTTLEDVDDAEAYRRWRSRLNEARRIS